MLPGDSLHSSPKSLKLVCNSNDPSYVENREPRRVGFVSTGMSPVRHALLRFPGAYQWLGLLILLCGPTSALAGSEPVTGRLIDGHTGTAMSDVAVHLIDESWSIGHEPWRCYGSPGRTRIPGLGTPGVIPTVLQSVHTDDAGNFRFEGDIPEKFRLDIDLPPFWSLPWSSIYGEWRMLTERGHTFQAYLYTTDYLRARMIDWDTGEPLRHCLFTINEFRGDEESVLSDDEGWVLSTTPFTSSATISSEHGDSYHVWPNRVPDAGTPFVSTNFIRERVELDERNTLRTATVRYALVPRYHRFRGEPELDWFEGTVVDEGRAFLLQPHFNKVGCGADFVRLERILIEADGGRLTGDFELPLNSEPLKLIEHRPIDVTISDASGTPITPSQVGWFEANEQVWMETNRDGQCTVWTTERELALTGFAEGYGAIRKRVVLEKETTPYARLTLAPDAPGSLEVVVRSLCNPPAEVREGVSMAIVRLEPLTPNALIETRNVLWRDQEAGVAFSDLSAGPYKVSVSPRGAFHYDSLSMIVNVPGPPAIFVRQDDVPVCKWIVELEGLPDTDSTFTFDSERIQPEETRERIALWDRDSPRRFSGSCGFINLNRSRPKVRFLVGHRLRVDASFELQLDFAHSEGGWHLQAENFSSNDFGPPAYEQDTLCRVLRIVAVKDD